MFVSRNVQIDVRVNQGKRYPTPTRTVQMPNVFVVPPEEDKAPTWCCFDAANPSLSQCPEPKEISPIAFYSEDNFYPSIDSVVQSCATTSVVDDALGNRCFDDEIETDSEYNHEPENGEEFTNTRTLRDAANDSDVIEVVKVGRTERTDGVEQDHHYRPPTSRSNRKRSFKSHASRAFKSLTGSLRSKSRSRDDISFSSRSSSPNERESRGNEHSHREFITRSQTPTALRRGSVILTQLFTAPLKTRSSISPSDELIPSPTQQNRLSESSDSAQSNPLSFNRSSCSYESSLHDQAASQIPSVTSRKSYRRISKISLQKFFLFGSSPPEDSGFNTSPSEEFENTAPVLRSVASTPAFSSSSSTSGPETPTSTEYQMPVRMITSSSMVDSSPDLPAFESLDTLFEQNLNLDLGLGVSLGSNSSITAASSPTTPRKTSSGTVSMCGAITSKHHSSVPVVESGEGDTSLEMRLDSLHFDSLSFDVDRF